MKVDISVTAAKVNADLAKPRISWVPREGLWQVDVVGARFFTTTWKSALQVVQLWREDRIAGYPFRLPTGEVPLTPLGARLWRNSRSGVVAR